MTELEQLKANAEAAAVELEEESAAFVACRKRYLAAQEAMNNARTAIVQYEEPVEEPEE